MDETEYLLRNPANAARLQKSINELERGNGIRMTLDELLELEAEADADPREGG